MIEIRSYPYLTPNPKHVTTLEDWHYYKSDHKVDLNELMHDWDSATEIDAEIKLKLNLKKILRDCGLGDDAKLRLVTGWRSSGTMLRGNGNRIDLDTNNSRSPLLLKVHINGTEVFHDFTVFAALILVSSGTEDHRLSPTVPGSVLWITENRILLNDYNLYFPTEIIDFNSARWGTLPDAAWYLQWDANDLFQTVFGDVQLYLNSAHPSILSALVNEQSTSDLIHQVLFFDIARNLIIGALSNQEFVNAPGDYPEGTIGAVIYNIICEYFPSESVAILHEKSKDKSLFEAVLQHHIGFLKA